MLRSKFGISRWWQKLRWLAVCVAGATFVAMFAAPASAESAHPSPHAYPVKGVDITEYQHEYTDKQKKNHVLPVEWTEIRRSGITFATLKATRGTNVKNGYFKNDLSRSLAQGIATAPYHFLTGYQPDTAAAQADYFINYVRYSGYTGHRIGELPPILDLEWTDDHTSSCPRYTNASQVQIWLDKVYSAFNVKPIIYTSRGFMDSCMKGTTKFSSYLLQVADYTSRHTIPALPAGWKSWTMWQYADVGSVPGVHTRNVTLDVFNGTQSQLDALSRNGHRSDDCEVRRPRCF